MLSDLDDLMKKSGFDAVLVYGESTASCPELAYLTRATIPRGGIYLKKHGQEPVLIVSNLDIPSAKKGIVSTVKPYTEYGLRDLQRRFGPGRGWSEFVAEVLRREKVSGTVALAGRFDAQQAIHLTEFLRRRGFKIRGSQKPTFIDQCRRTKDSWETERIAEAGRKTVAVAETLEKTLEQTRVINGKAFYDNKPLTAETLRNIIRKTCAEKGLRLPEGFILAIGPEAADPHYVDEKNTPITEGAAILFDIYPADSTGYRYDFTRTYCVGKPSRLLRKMFNDVQEAQQAAFDSIAENIPCETPFIKTCQTLSARRWPTPLQRKIGERGFVHGLGHGIGLTIGEEPYLTRFNNLKLLSGDVVTVEPGLYEPGFGGVRIEDVVIVEGSKCRILAEHRIQLEF